MDRRHASGPDVIRVVSTGQFLDLLGIRIDPVRAESASFTINLITPDNGERFVVELSNGTLTKPRRLPRGVDGIYAAISALGIGVFVGGGLGGLIGARLSVGASDEPE